MAGILWHPLSRQQLRLSELSLAAHPTDAQCYTYLNQLFFDDDQNLVKKFMTAIDGPCAEYFEREMQHQAEKSRNSL